MRLAFLTPEFPTNSPYAGGLASFLGRLTRELVLADRSVTVFTPDPSGSAQCDWYGVQVVSVSATPAPARGFDRIVGKYWGRINTEQLHQSLVMARRLYDRMSAAEQVAPFDVIHGSDYGLTTWFVPRRAGRTVIVRSSSLSAECRRWWGGGLRLDHFLFSRMEHELFRRADLAYAPSQRTATYYTRRAGVPVSVIRPPFDPARGPGEPCSSALPPRYLLHFGNINRVKGSDWLARALVTAWRTEPQLRMVWAGTDAEGWLPRFQRQWGPRAAQVTWLGAVPRTEIGAVVAGAAGIVAPSRVDNLPNTVLEAQAAGVPVIGGLDSSIEEIVVDGVTGRMVQRDDVAGLAKALVEAWRGQPPFHQRCARPPIFAEMNPEVAVARLLESIETVRQRQPRAPKEPVHD